MHGEPEPFVVKVGNIQHLATPIRAQLAESHSAIELAGLLHPTPAIGGEPREPALRLIDELEGIDRGWYAGPVGWMDAAEDGEFCVGLRSALLRDRDAHLFAGCGIVADSDPAAELQESELKFEALLPCWPRRRTAASAASASSRWSARLRRAVGADHDHPRVAGQRLGQIRRVSTERRH